MADENQTNNRGELTAIILALMWREEELARGGVIMPIVDLVKILLAWKAAYGNSILFVHIYSHTGKEDLLSIGNTGADKIALGGGD